MSVHYTVFFKRASYHFITPTLTYLQFPLIFPNYLAEFILSFHYISLDMVLLIYRNLLRRQQMKWFQKETNACIIYILKIAVVDKGKSLEEKYVFTLAHIWLCEIWMFNM